MDKETLRKHYKELRLGIADKAVRSQRIMEQIIASPRYQKAHIVAVYAAMPVEVDTAFLILHAWKQKKTVVFPRVENNDLSFYRLESFAELDTRSSFGIREPSPRREGLVSKKDIDLILVPGLCFDQKKYRVGYGKGYYDRYLKGCPAYKLGIGFKEQRYQGDIPIHADDVPVDEIVSD